MFCTFIFLRVFVNSVVDLLIYTEKMSIYALLFKVNESIEIIH